MSEKQAMTHSDIEENMDYNDDKNWKYVKTYDRTIAKKREYKESKTNRIYRRGEDGKVYISYENKPSKYSQGNY